MWAGLGRTLSQSPANPSDGGFQMLTPAQEANSKARVEILRDISTWGGFDRYFYKDWQRKEMRAKLSYADVDLPLVGEWAMWSFHELPKDEGKWKRARGEEFKLAQRISIESCNRAASAYSIYSSLPNYTSGIAQVNEAFSGLVQQNVNQARTAYQLLDRAESTAVFDSRRLGSNWNCLYLVLLKYYISEKTGWNETGTMNAVSHLVGAAHHALRRMCPKNLRVLLQKTIRHFEENPYNATLIFLVQNLVLNPQQLYQEFPRVRISAQSAA
jgi:hypothetical protein